jgi:carbamoyltransferase
VTAILGISAFYHDSAAALLVDGRIVAAAQEERFTRKKHDASFPNRAIAYCLEEAALEPPQIEYVSYYEKPLAKFDRLLESYLAFAPRGFFSFCRAMPAWLKEKLHLPSIIRRALPDWKGNLVFTDHHESHAASAFFASPFEEAAILTLDGVGEWNTTTRGVGEGNRVTLTDHLQFPHSLGLLYSAFTYYCGFRVNSGEYKLMGLAPYGRPIYVEAIRKHLIDLKPDGSFWLNMAFFNYCHGLTMTNRRFQKLFGGPPRRPETPLLQRHMDLAASIQAVTEEVVLRITCDLYQKSKQKFLTMAGGVALNCVANGRLLREGPFEDIWIQPAAGDAGGALGAALFLWHQLLDKPRSPKEANCQQGSLLGPRYSATQIRQLLNKKEAHYQRFENEMELLEFVAELLEEGKAVGWFQGRMEFGPRALGARSVLGDPRVPGMQAQMNLKIKFRESFRPFAPAVLREHAHEWFDIPEHRESPYMLLVASVRREHRTPISRQQETLMRRDPDLRNRLNVIRSSVPAITHVDYSARLQTVDEERNPRFYRLLHAFHRITGCPMLINTSFNVRGEPIVCTPEDAYRCFEATEMDALVMEDFVVEKKADANLNRTAMAEAHLSHFQLD